MIVSRQLARFVSSRASLRYLSVSALCFPFFSLSGTGLDRSALALNSLGIISFADLHPINPVVSYRYRNHRGEGATPSRATRPNSAQFWCNVSSFRINTCESVSIQTTLSPFRINTYEKTGGWGAQILRLPYSVLLHFVTSSHHRTERELAAYV